jgi:hypothetical protein
MVELAEQGRLACLAFRVPRHEDLDGHRRPAPPGYRAPHLAGAPAPQPLLEGVPGHHRRGLGWADGSGHAGDRRTDAHSAAAVVHRPDTSRQRVSRAGAEHAARSAELSLVEFRVAAT